MKNNQDGEDYVSNDEFMQIIDDLARMESRITVIEDKLSEIKDNSREKSKAMLEDSIFIGNDQYVCMKYIRKEPCIVNNLVRKIGFDLCFDEDSICPWAFKLHVNE